jgi:ribonuclease D
MAIHFHEEDLAEGTAFADGPIAVDTEAMGLVPGRDRLCLVQLADGKGDEHLVRFRRGSDYAAPNLKALLGDPNRVKLYHFARFDIGIIQAYLGIMATPLYCTRTASRLVRTYTDRHGLKDLVKKRRAARLCRERRSLSSCVEGQTRPTARARGSRGVGPGLFRFPSGPCPARSRRLGRAGYLCP